MTDATQTSATPEAQEPAHKRYRSLGAAVKANDAQAVRDICVYLQDEGQLPEDSDDEFPMSTLLWQAAGLSTPEVMKVLIEFGANPKVNIAIPGSEPGVYSAFNVVERAVFMGKPDNVAWLIRNGYAEVEDSNHNEHTLFIQAVIENRFDVADRLLAMGADINATNLRGNSALHISCGMPVNVKAVEYLINKGIDPTLEAIDGAVASQRIPVMEDGPEVEMLDSLYNAIEDYYEAYTNGQGRSFTFPTDVAAIFDPDAEQGTGSEVDDDTMNSILGKVMGGGVTTSTSSGAPKVKAMPMGSGYAATPAGWELMEEREVVLATDVEVDDSFNPVDPHLFRKTGQIEQDDQGSYELCVVGKGSRVYVTLMPGGRYYMADQPGANTCHAELGQSDFVLPNANVAPTIPAAPTTFGGSGGSASLSAIAPHPDASKYYFSVGMDPNFSEVYVAITSVQYFDQHGCLDDQGDDGTIHAILSSAYPARQVGELMESAWEVPFQDPNGYDIIQTLTALGFQRSDDFDQLAGGISQVPAPTPSAKPSI